MVARSRTQGGQWSRWIGGGALVLALTGLLAPATTSAAARIVGHEVIVVEGEAPEAPWNPSMGIGGHPSGTSNSYPSGDSGGGGGGGGVSSGGGSVPSGGGSGSVYTAEFRLKNAENQCTSAGGTWREEAFDDFGDENLVHIGYLCISKVAVTSNPPFNGYREWRYYDSDGFMNYMCYGDSEVRICEKNVP